MKKIFIIFLFLMSVFNKVYANKYDDLYGKIDLFGEVLEKINQEYIDKIDQSEVMDSAINGVLQSLDPYSSYMSPELFKDMQTDTKGEFGGLGIEIGMEAGVVKVISPIDGTPAARAGIKAGDYIVKINERASRIFDKINCEKEKSKKSIGILNQKRNYRDSICKC